MSKTIRFYPIVATLLKGEQDGLEWRVVVCEGGVRMLQIRNDQGEWETA